jgi:hypothetical protein
MSICLLSRYSCWWRIFNMHIWYVTMWLFYNYSLLNYFYTDEEVCIWWQYLLYISHSNMHRKMLNKMKMTYFRFMALLYATVPWNCVSIDTISRNCYLLFLSKLWWEPQVRVDRSRDTFCCPSPFFAEFRLFFDRSKICHFHLI